MTLHVYKLWKNDLKRQLNAFSDNIIEIIIDDTAVDNNRMLIIRDNTLRMNIDPIGKWYERNLTLEQYIDHYDIEGKFH